MRGALADISRQYEDLKVKYERTERELIGRIRELEMKFNEKERESITNLNILQSNEREMEELKAQNRRLHEELDGVHGEYSERMHKAEKAKKSHLVKNF